MNKSSRIISCFLAGAVLFASCSSSTMIVSNPSNSKLYIDGEMVGQTPYTHRDSKIVGSVTSVKIEKEGYMPLFADFSKNEEADVGAIIGGLMVWIPFLWTMKYKSTHSYELKPIALDNVALDNDMTLDTPQIQNNPRTKTVKLRELKQLLNEKIITAEEFEKEKTKVLNMED